MKVLGGIGKKILYLDYDGVLHPEGVYRDRHRGIFLGNEFVGHRLFENANFLCEKLYAYPDVHIVLSTTWVRVLGFSRAKAYLPESLAARVVGATYHSHMPRDIFVEQSRPMQVVADVRRRRPSAWLAVDDVDEGWPQEALPNFVATHPRFGCAEPFVRKELEARLAMNFGSDISASEGPPA